MLLILQIPHPIIAHPLFCSMGFDTMDKKERAMNYLAKILTSGAIRETPKRVIEAIANEVTITDQTIILEAGAGQGEITQAILDKNKDATDLTYYAFEIDEESCQHLSHNFPDIILKQNSVFDFEQYIPEEQQLDYFISSIPLSFYKNEVLDTFLEKVETRLKPGGKLIIIFTAAWLLPLFKKHFPHLISQTFLTFPPYFMIVAGKENK